MVAADYNLSSGSANGIGKNVRIKVLFVDDDLAILGVSKQILEVEADLDVDSANSVDDALKKLCEQTYDVIVSDYEMPIKSGLDFLKELRDQKNQIPFILFTGRGREEVAIKALNLGADGYYSKHGSPETVYGELAHGIKIITEKEKAKEACQESQKRYLTLMEHASDAVIIHDLDGKIIEVNERACRYLGYTKEELLTLNIKDIDSEFGENKKGALFWARALAGRTVTFESNYIRKDKVSFPVEASLSSTTFNKEAYVVALIRDIRDRKIKEETLIRSKQNLAEAQRIAHVGSWEWNMQNNLWTCSDELFRIFGLELLSGPVNSDLLIERIHADDRESYIENMRSSLAIGVPIDHEFRLILPDGLMRVAIVKGEVVEYDSLGKPLRMVGTIQDITENRKKEQKLVEQANLLQIISDAIIATDENFIIKSWNKAAEEIYGWKEEEVIGKKLFEIINLVYQKDKDDLKRELYKNGFWKGEMQQQHKNGRTLNITSAVSMVKNPQGKAVGSVLVNRDSSQQAEVDKYMRISAYLFDVATDSIFVHDLDGYIIFFNEAAYKSRGYTYDEMTKMNIKDLDSPEYRVKFDFAIKHLLEKNIETFEGAHLRKDGSVMPIEIRARIIEIDNQKLILSVVRDITERKKSEAELEESKEEYRSLFVNMIDGFAYCKIVRNQDAEPVDIEYLEVNDTFEKILDLKKENVIGKKITEIIPDVNKIHPELIEMYGIVADTGKGQKFEIFFKPLNRWLFVSLYCPRKEYVVSIFEDITDRKLNEAQLQADKQEIENVSEKLRVIGRLTRHDVQNKLAIVEGNSYLLKKEVFDNTKAIQYLNGITIALEDIKKILEVSNLYEKVGVEKLSDINVTQAFNEAVSNSSNLKEIQVINNCSNLYVKADSMLRQLFYNLIDNSIEHGKKVTQIKFSCKEEKDQIYLIYEDNGIGIPAANKVQLFKERFTTGNGSGLGLKLIKRMLDVYGWTINENGEPEKGARFIIKIPKMKKAIDKSISI